MATNRNGCVPSKFDISVGETVQLMTRDAALAVSRKHGSGTPVYSKETDKVFAKYGYRAVVRESSGDNLAVSVTNCSIRRVVSKDAVFGIAHNPLDVVDVGMRNTPGVPPVRRLFIAYSFDSEFSPVVVTYDEDDTLSILDDRNSAKVDLECSEIWTFCYPSRSQCTPVDELHVTLIRNGRSINPSSLTSAQWASLRG